jgi:hypothetical protein
MTAKAWERFHAGMTVMWVLLAVPTLLWWKESILWVAVMSLWANAASHWAAYQASRVEEKSDASGS